MPPVALELSILGGLKDDCYEKVVADMLDLLEATVEADVGQAGRLSLDQSCNFRCRWEGSKVSVMDP